MSPRHPEHGVVDGRGERDHEVSATSSVPDMDTPHPRDRSPRPVPRTLDAREALWADLVHELTELHARLEYLRLLLKLGVGDVRRGAAG